MDTKIYFETWAEKLSVPIENIQSEFDSLLKEEQTIHKTLDDEDQQKRALQRLVLLYKKQLRSPAIGFEGMIIGVGDLFDTAKKMREAAMDAFRINPHDAIQNRITDDIGNPLDTREVFGTGRKNQDFGKLLPQHSYIRNVVGLALRTNAEESPKTFSLTLNGDKAEHLKFPMFKPVRFRAINKSEENANQFILNGSTVTTFTIDENIKMPAPADVLNKSCKEMFVSLGDIQEYHTANKDDFNRLALIEGDVSIIGTEPTSVGNRLMVIEDMNRPIDDFETAGLTCWVPKSTNIDFGEGSKVIVVGKTSQGKSRDNPNELGDVMMNVLGIYAIPEYKIEPLTDDNIDEAIAETQEKLDADKTEVKENLGNEPAIEKVKEIQTEITSW